MLRRQLLYPLSYGRPPRPRCASRPEVLGVTFRPDRLRPRFMPDIRQIVAFGEGDRFFARVEQQAKLRTRVAGADPAHQRIGEALGDKIFTVSAVLLWAALTAVTFAAYWEW